MKQLISTQERKGGNPPSIEGEGSILTPMPPHHIKTLLDFFAVTSVPRLIKAEMEKKQKEVVKK